MKNYAGHRLSPWLGHLMVSRQETARPLMTPGEVMQLPPDDEIVMVAGVPPIRAKKARYFEDRRLAERVLLPPKPMEPKPEPKPDDWSKLAPIRPIALGKPPPASTSELTIQQSTCPKKASPAVTPPTPDAARARARTAQGHCAGAREAADQRVRT